VLHLWDFAPFGDEVRWDKHSVDTNIADMGCSECAYVMWCWDVGVSNTTPANIQGFE